MNEQLLKRLQDSMKMLSVCLEQLQEVGWLVHDIIEDLELELNPILGSQAPKTLETSTSKETASQ